MRLAGYSLEDICRTTMTPNERPMLERVDGRNDIYWLEADFRYADIRTVGGIPFGNRFRRIEPVSVIAVPITAWCPLTRVSRRAFGNACGPSPLEIGTTSQSGFWPRIVSPSEATMGPGMFVA